MTLYQITGTITETYYDQVWEEECSVTHQLPTFYLNSNVQGIVNEAHALKIALNIVNPTHRVDIKPSLFVLKM